MLEEADILELRDRYNFLAQKYVELAIDLTPKFEKFGKYRKELQLLSAEFIRRGADLEDPVSLQKIIEEEIAKRKKDGEHDQT